MADPAVVLAREFTALAKDWYADLLAARARIGELEAENARLKKSPYSMSVAELQAAIAPLQGALHHKILGDQTKGVYVALSSEREG